MVKKMVCKGFTVTERTDGTFHIKYISKGSGKTWSDVLPDFCSVGEWVWNMADNHELARAVNHKMCVRWGRSFL